MNVIFTLLLLASGYSIWFFAKKRKNKNYRNISILTFVLSFILIGITSPTEKTTQNKQDEVHSEALKYANEIISTPASFSEYTFKEYLVNTSEKSFSSDTVQYIIDNISEDTWVNEALDIAKEERENGKTDEEILASLTDEYVKFTQSQAEAAIQKLNK
ncbi:TPA: DUF3290 family protein [Streptococcus suis 89-3576-3]|uniref:DUF3290 family protein n=1 Tax=Streptococcus suis TaxID=1307 RepID=UPI0003FF957E|nr:DUF3290 family protein [Streptococcus suis]QBX21118.1 hypothetical protein Javan553_0043 [Streptococcus phage Javan553]HEM3168961.1 DUF3290 family protein [Streptococcus suis 89-3576-3]